MISVTTHNQKEIDINGTYLQGELDVDFALLVEIFGEPIYFNEVDDQGNKVDAEWELEFTDHDTGEIVVASIYNYKDGINYLGEEGEVTEAIRDWHVGGRSEKAFELVKRFVEGR